MLYDGQLARQATININNTTNNSLSGMEVEIFRESPTQSPGLALKFRLRDKDKSLYIEKEVIWWAFNFPVGFGDYFSRESIVLEKKKQERSSSTKKMSL